MSKLYDLLGAIISCVKNTASAIPKKMSELENDAGFITEQKQADWNQNNPEAADHVKIDLFTRKPTPASACLPHPILNRTATGIMPPKTLKV